MNSKLFDRFRDLIYKECGICLAPSKQTLLQSRISKRMRTLGIGDEQDYLGRVTEDRTGEEMILLLDAISTNVTYFFREPDHFDQLQLALAQSLESGQKKIRIWSAACSSGQEPYTIGMIALDAIEKAGIGGVDLRILATDISTRILAAAERGEYAEREIEHISAEHRKRYLTSIPSKTAAKMYSVNDELRQLVTFRRLNLSKPPFPMQGPMDLIFCRNVMIYFDTTVRARLVAEMVRLLKPNGLLMIGHAESLMGIDAGLVTVAPSIYRKAAKS